MSDNTPVTDAGQVLRDALTGDDTAAQQAALNELTSLSLFLSSRNSGQVRALIRCFAKEPNQYYRLLLALLHPRWTNGGESLASQAPPFAEVKDDLMAGIEAATGDAQGFIPPIIGRYGPDAVSVLPQLIDRLRTHRQDCSIAPGLPWTIYQIGGFSEEVEEVLLEVARDPNSCPHASPIAQEILTLYGVSWE